MTRQSEGCRESPFSFSAGSELIHKPLKSQSSRRTLPISGAMEVLEAAKAAQLIDGPANPLGLVFLNDAGRPLDQKYIAPPEDDQ
ncbi:MAG: hypothetical protein ACR2HJ_12715 [Fimbriimonadales bacterium]